MSAALPNRKPRAAPATLYYPESDGKPMAETDTHRDAINDYIYILKTAFAAEPDVYVTGNIMFYYVEGDVSKATAPDVMLVRGVPKEPPRRTYKLWEEGQAPQVVIEISSRKTWAEDLNKKWTLYQQLGVLEYYISDPEYDYLPDPLIGYHLKNGEFVRIEAENGRIYSPVLGLELVDTGAGLRFFNPRTQEFLPTAREEHEIRVATETALAETETALIEERAARERAEAELARLQAELARRQD